ncbi:pteridine reductase [Penaeus vannamei]|uniref:Pteridine reductase n=2 Tax=Penaeus vannamei TaxID=6689 RepID=A0A3R7SXL9_PENVA|nr:uncharacterized protein LOC113812901 [Penaeus vannamei]ROT80149.1 pteridine reductase [Penaeus vannamei]
MTSRLALVTTGSEREWKVCERSSSSLTMATTATGRTAMPESQWGEGRVALVTGGARRVGRATVFALHRRGFNVVVHCNNSRTEAQAVADELNSIRPKSAHVISGDLSVAVAATAQRLVAEAQAQWGRLDLLVNNASLFFPTPIAEASEDTWTRLMNTNAMSPFFLMKAAAPHVKEVGGSIINIGDIGGETPTPPYFTIYSMTKAALIMATKQLAIELAPEIRVNYINPGAVIWPETDVGNTYQKEWLSRTPLGREGTGEDVAEAAVFLASPAAAYITGSSINVCGGRSVMT